MRYYEYKIKVERTYVGESPATRVNNPSEVAKYLREVVKLDQEPQDHFVAIYLNVKNKIIGFETVGIGNLSGCMAGPREVFRGAIVNNAAGVIVAHNHPSGDPTPSVTDLEATRRLADAGKIINISLADHIIIGDEDYYSCKEQGVF